MNKKIAGMLLMVLMLSASSLWAKPERLQVKDPGQRVKENSAKAQLKNIDLQKIEDPEARKAIREILNYLNLQTQR